ncbi:MAG: bifunctional adenosylcobinamide kinase/adenosylcobinamide-phosphate guanylyltransferase [Pseudanabaenaceae cyanobacterium bins.68]|nr:bifunctional adenosylcobinamide kinase/adenosylcobinamide-phosphate guanylyltransferase [Pseudanabaenaceae cyanobacterium bins.68]
MLTLVIGPSRSGKSEWAEVLARRSGKAVIYIATAQPNPQDLEWSARLELHRDRRDPSWHLVEVPLALSDAIARVDPCHYVLVDALGTWVANCLEQTDQVWQDCLEEFLTVATSFDGDLTLVAEEVGWGVVPEYISGRIFRDRLGRLTRCLGAIAAQVYLVTGGHVLRLDLLGERLNS